MYPHCCLSHSSWYVSSLCYILSWSSLSMYIHLDYHVSYLACLYIWLIYLLFVWLLVVWLLFFYVTTYVACLCGTHAYPLISDSLILVDLISLDLIFDMRLVTLFILWLEHIYVDWSLIFEDLYSPKLDFRIFVWPMYFLFCFSFIGFSYAPTPFTMHLRSSLSD